MIKIVFQTGTEIGSNTTEKLDLDPTNIIVSYRKRILNAAGRIEASYSLKPGSHMIDSNLSAIVYFLVGKAPLWTCLSLTHSFRDVFTLNDVILYVRNSLQWTFCPCLYINRPFPCLESMIDMRLVGGPKFANGRWSTKHVIVFFTAAKGIHIRFKRFLESDL